MKELSNISKIPDADQSRLFWRGIRSESKEHDRNAKKN